MVPIQFYQENGSSVTNGSGTKGILSLGSEKMDSGLTCQRVIVVEY